MFVPSDKIPDNSRIWVYQSDRKFSKEEEEQISTYAKGFVNTWTAHNQDLKASFEIRYGIFLIIMIDSNHALASGCSIDKSLHFIQKLEKEFSVSLLDRQLFAYRDGNEIKFIRKRDFEKQVEREISTEAIIFNNLVQTKSELETSWEVPIRESWHGALRAI